MATEEKLRLRPVPTVKSDPWKKGVRRRLPRFQLWSNEFWKKIGELNMLDGSGKRSPFRGKVLEAICRENLRLYGRP